MLRHLRRLERIWIDSPIYFITTSTRNRRPILGKDSIANILIEEWSSARHRHGWVIGRYVIMPDHVHFFCQAEYEAERLPEFVGAWKSWTSRKINELLIPRSATAATASPMTTTPLWQREFFDHVLRSNESYSEKWNYVFTNPVRAGLVASAANWKYAGQIGTLIL